MKNIFNKKTSESPNINPLSLKFDSDDLNKSFAIHQAVKSIRLVRLSIAIAILIYIVFGFIQNTIMPGGSEDIKIIRIAGIVFFSAIILLSFMEFFKQHYQLMMIVLMIFGGTDVILIAINGEEFLYVGLILSVIYAHSLLRMRFIYASLTTWLLVISYQISSAIWGSVTIAEIINSSFFLSSANTLGMFASYGIEYYMRSEYLKSYLLKEKSAELNNEYVRKSNELESARQIQLSMLPQALPEHPELEIAVTMQTASEIGGDYYDFHLAEDNTLTFAIGDATGHGAKAGAMVTAIKTLFSNYAPHMELTEFLKKSNHFIKQIKLPNLYMSLGVGKIKDDILEISGVGLPPFLIFRNSSGSIEELPLKGIPLGSFTTFPFIKRTIKLSPDDTLVFMTDGLPELFNKQKEMFGYEKIREILLESNQHSVKEILDEIKIKASDWNNHQQDDITLLIIRKKGKASDNSLIDAKNINLSFKDRTLN